MPLHVHSAIRRIKFAAGEKIRINSKMTEKRRSCSGRVGNRSENTELEISCKAYDFIKELNIGIGIALDLIWNDRN